MEIRPVLLQYLFFLYVLYIGLALNKACRRASEDKVDLTAAAACLGRRGRGLKE